MRNVLAGGVKSSKEDQSIWMTAEQPINRSVPSNARRRFRKPARGRGWGLQITNANTVKEPIGNTQNKGMAFHHQAAARFSLQ